MVMLDGVTQETMMTMSRRQLQTADASAALNRYGTIGWRNAALLLKLMRRQCGEESEEDVFLIVCQ